MLRASAKSKPKAAPQVPFKIDVMHIGVSLQFSSFEFLYGSLYRRTIMKEKKHEVVKVSDKEFHSAIKLFHQILLIV